MIFDIFPTIVAALGIPAPVGIDGTNIFAVQSPRVLHWYSHRKYVDTFVDIYSILSANGLWRLNTRETWKEVDYKLIQHLDLLSLESNSQSRLPSLNLYNLKW